MISFELILKYLKSAIAISILGAISIIVFIFYLAQNLPSLDQLENYDPDLITRISLSPSSPD